MNLVKEKVMNIEYRVHWLSVTIWASFANIQRLWDLQFKRIFGPLIDKRHGGSGFKRIHESLGGLQIYHDAINVGTDGEGYVSFRIPGEACDAIDPYFFFGFISHIIENYRINVTRLDFAFDYVDFTPKEFFQAVKDGKVRTYAKQSTFKLFESPWEPQEQGGKVGCSTAQIGSPSSDRKLRVYDKRGYSRVELEARRDRANAITREVLTKDPIYWGEQFIGHLRDFVDLIEDKESEMLVDFWAEFIQSIPRANMKVTDPKEKSKDRMMGWLHGSVAPSLSAAVDIYGEDVLKDLYDQGLENRGDRFDAILPEDKRKPKGGKRGRN